MTQPEKGKRPQAWLVMYVTTSIDDNASKTGKRPDEDKWQVINRFDLPAWLDAIGPMQRVMRGEAVCYDPNQGGFWYKGVEVDGQEVKKVKAQQRQLVVT